MHKTDKRVSYRRAFTTIDWIHEYDIDVEKRDIFLLGREDYVDMAESSDDIEEPGVEWAMANRFIKNIGILKSLSNDPILIHMKTCGGDWTEGMAIYDAIKACPCYVTILSYTWARSMSSLILQAADKRALMPHSTFVFHDGTFGTYGTVKQAMTDLDQLKISHQQMMDVYLDQLEGHPYWKGKTRAQIASWMRAEMNRKEDVYLPADQAVAMGFADLVFGKDGKYDWNSLRG